MPRIYTDKPVDGLLTQRVINAIDMRHERAKILSEVVTPPPYAYEDLQITIHSNKVFPDGRLEVIASAFRNGKPVFVDNPLYYLNPPIKAPNGTWRKETIEGIEADLENFDDNPEEALKQIVGQTIALNS